MFSSGFIAKIVIELNRHQETGCWAKVPLERQARFKDSCGKVRTVVLWNAAAIFQPQGNKVP